MLLPQRHRLAGVTPLLQIPRTLHPDTVAIMSTWSGFSLGVIFDQHKIGYRVTGAIVQRLTRYVVGLMLLLIIFEGLAILLPHPENVWHLPVNILRYAEAGFWISAGAPWLFQRLNSWQLSSQRLSS